MIHAHTHRHNDDDQDGCLKEGLLDKMLMLISLRETAHVLATSHSRWETVRAQERDVLK